INNSFYKLPTDHAVDQWREQAPGGFVYALKSSRFLTHNKTLKDAAEPLELVLSKARRLGQHLGHVLYQLPPNWKRNLDRLAEFLKLLPAEIVHVIEFRNRDWLANETYELLSEHQVCLCVHDILPRHPRRVTGPAIYVRLHGAAGARYEIGRAHV